MDTAQQYLDQLLFAVLPYLALLIFFVMTIQRYLTQKFTYSSLSSQFLENEQHFWALVPFHYGIIVVLLGHIVAFLLPSCILGWNGHPIRLYVLEITALIFGMLTLFGLVSIFWRRLTNVKARTVTSGADWVLYALLTVQAFTGVYTAVLYPWGSSWFAASAAPYLWSILTLNPDINYVIAMPFMVKLHIVNACLVIGFFPFTRLVHILVIPNPYLWRKPQVVRWNWKPDVLRGSRK
jgi:nitrate reductase gamma subunit